GSTGGDDFAQWAPDHAILSVDGLAYQQGVGGVAAVPDNKKSSIMIAGDRRGSQSGIGGPHGPSACRPTRLTVFVQHLAKHAAVIRLAFLPSQINAAFLIHIEGHRAGGDSRRRDEDRGAGPR